MGSIDATTWQAVGVTLTIVCVLLSLLVWRRRGPVAGLRGIAWSLLPAAAGLTGTLKLLWDIGNEVLRWATRLVFDPLVWSGIALAGCALVLFALTAALRARGVGAQPRTARAELPKDRSATAATPPRGRRAADAAGGPQAGGADDGMDDIEAILRKHGIS